MDEDIDIDIDLCTFDRLWQKQRVFMAALNGFIHELLEAAISIADLVYPYVDTLAGIKAIWALGLEACESAGDKTYYHAQGINRRDFSPIRPAGDCFYRRSGRTLARAGLPRGKDRLRGGEEVA